MAEKQNQHKVFLEKQILSAAETVFSRKAFESVTMKEIAAECGVSVASIYRYYKCKEDLYISMLLPVLTALSDRIRKAARSDFPAEIKLERMLKALTGLFYKDPGNLIRLIHLQSWESMENISNNTLCVMMARSREVHRAISSVMAQGIDEGLFIDEHPCALADVFWGVFSGVVVLSDTADTPGGSKPGPVPDLMFCLHLIRQGMKLY